MSLPRRFAARLTNVSRVYVRVVVASLLSVFAAVTFVSPAAAAITKSRVTRPTARQTYAIYNWDVPNTIAVQGTTDSTAPMTDKVDLRCFYGDNGQSHLLQAGVSLAPNGSFSVPAASLYPISPAVCRLRAVPAGSTDNRPVFSGPLMIVGGLRNEGIIGGPNAGTAWDFSVYAQQVSAAAIYASIGDCGMDESYLFDNAYGRTANVFACNAFFSGRNLNGLGDTRSEMQVDGQDAYASAQAVGMFNRTGACPPACDGSQDNPGLPPLSYSLAQNHANGDVTIKESESIVRCPIATPFPPGRASCVAFSPTGVKVQRTINQTGGGHVVWITDSYSSTDGKAHALDLLYQNNQRVSPFAGLAADVGYRFPNRSTYTSYARGQTVSVPGGPRSILIKNLTADDGDPYTGQGAITYATAPSQILFITTAGSPHSDFTMHYKASVPASGTRSYTFVYSTDFTTAAVSAEAAAAQDKLTPCTVPKLAGKTLTAAKPALTKAHCSLGKLTNKHTHAVPSGRVISSDPKAGSTRPNGTKVNLTISRG